LYYIYYAQNFEDVMLWRALKHIKNGFYIDIGAWDPVIDSVSNLFYENGWRGINVGDNHLDWFIDLPPYSSDSNDCFFLGGILF